jgi:hypothetical protein
MIWLAWRQFRTQAAVVLGAVAVFAVLLGATGPGLADRYARGGDFLGEMSARDTALYVLGVLACCWHRSSSACSGAPRS